MNQFFKSAQANKWINHKNMLIKYRSILILINFVISNAELYESVHDVCALCKCSWMDSKTVILDCFGKNFIHLIPMWPKEFPNNNKDSEIRAIFSGNSLTHLQELPSTNASVSFSCRHCNIESFNGPIFIDVPNIKSLDLSWNKIGDNALSGGVLRGPYKENSYEPLGLIRLDLSHNYLTNLDSTIFEHLPKLIYLNLGSNNLSALNVPTTDSLNMLTNLEELNLSNNHLVFLSDNMFIGLKQLKFLNIQDNLFTKIPIQLKNVGLTLTFLNIANSSIDEIGETSFDGLYALKVINISNSCLLKQINPNAFSKLDEIGKLLINKNKLLTEIDVTCLNNKKELSVVDISDCSLEFIYMSSDETTKVTSEGWSKLRKFDIDGNNWVCNCNFYKVIEMINKTIKHSFDNVRCNNPYLLAGRSINTLNKDFLCSELSKLQALKFVEEQIEDEPPKFLRPRNIGISIIVIAIVIIIGIIIGFGIVTIKRKLRSEQFIESHIRYSTVRNSTFQTIN